MAQRMQVIIVDDLTGETLPDDQVQSVRFALDGTVYEIDLKKENADRLRDDFKRYVQAARKVTRGTANVSTARSGNNRKNTAAIRAWARTNGHQVSERGRIASSVVEAYAAKN